MPHGTTDALLMASSARPPGPAALLVAAVGAQEPGRAARSRAREHAHLAARGLEECEQEDRFAGILDAFSLS